jgi:hypothetical protein
MNTLAVTLTPWAVQRITGAVNGRVTKTALKKSLVDFPDTEFHTIAGFHARGGAVVTTREAVAAGYDMLEVRSPRMELLAAIYLTDGKVKVS